MTIRTDDILFVQNNEDVDRIITWNSRNFVLKPGAITYIPAAAAFVWFGDPRSAENVVSLTDESGLTEWVPDRATEVRRLRIKYGAVEGDEASFEGVRIPDVTVKTVDGEDIKTVLDDPSGRSVMKASDTLESRDDLLAMLQKQQRQIALLMEQEGTAVPRLGEDVETIAEPPSDDAPVVHAGRSK